jgi:hypothetical protein
VSLSFIELPAVFRLGLGAENDDRALNEIWGSLSWAVHLRGAGMAGLREEARAGFPARALA